MEIVGWIGSIMLAICALPQAYTSYKHGHSNGLTWTLLLLWGGGEAITLIYVLSRSDWPLVANYGLNVVAMSVIIWFKWKPRKIDEKN
jgi:uncharacterized protein with PQ loop repeat